ncbi:MAG: HutP family protein [Firmicutes bacterium]|nr:HutP family protein [Bacillota bacterium]
MTPICRQDGRTAGVADISSSQLPISGGVPGAPYGTEAPRARALPGGGTPVKDAVARGNSASREVARAALRMALSADHAEERHEQRALLARGIRATAVDFGGDFTGSVRRVIERAVVAAKREGVIAATHAEEGAVAGAAHEALVQAGHKAAGLSVGGKVGVARRDDHIAVAIFLGIGLLHLDEVAVGLAHRAVSPL